MNRRVGRYVMSEHGMRFVVMADFMTSDGWGDWCKGCSTWHEAKQLKKSLKRQPDRFRCVEVLTWDEYERQK